MTADAWLLLSLTVLVILWLRERRLMAAVAVLLRDVQQLETEVRDLERALRNP